MSLPNTLSRLIVISTFILAAHARAVNISNTWMLPEEGFPVFYRHFRDRVSWYEADAVCQFHHANLVTADSTSQYDAIRAYLKELDVTSNVWIGLSKTSEKGKFTWSNYQTLNGMGHWQDSIPVGNNPLCVVMDPSSDFLWKTMPCGGPDVATFICELPIPEWASGPKGCLVTEIPSLTVLYIPEHTAIELTSDCGLDGTKRIACKGDADREELLKQLTCSINQDDDFDDKATKMLYSTTQSGINQEENTLNSKTTKPWIWTSNTIDTEYGIPTRHRRETEDTLSPISTKSTTSTDSMLQVTNSTEGNKSTQTPSANPTKVASSESELVHTQSTQHEESIIEMSTISQMRSDHPETIVETAPTSDTKYETTSTFDTTEESASTSVTDESEYSGAISQGQLLSIIENGTRIDFVEMSGSEVEDAKTNESSNTVASDYLYTTTATEKMTATTIPELIMNNKKESKEQKHIKKSIYPKKNNPKLSKTETSTPVNVNISKEVAVEPIVHDNSIILNRTYRKEVPLIPDSYKTTTTQQAVSTTQQTPTTGKPRNLTLILSATLDEKEKSSDVNTKIENDAATGKLADSKESDKPTTNIHETELLTPKPTINKSEINNEEPAINNFETDNSSRTYDYGDFSESFSNNSLISEPGKVPNRQRHLTRPQRRQFYPYFFSRVLG